LAKKKQGLWIQSKVITSGEGVRQSSRVTTPMSSESNRMERTYQGKPFKSLKDAREKLASIFEFQKYSISSNLLGRKIRIFF
jgi:hypothetical protein